MDESDEDKLIRKLTERTRTYPEAWDALVHFVNEYLEQYLQRFWPRQDQDLLDDIRQSVFAHLLWTGGGDSVKHYLRSPDRQNAFALMLWVRSRARNELFKMLRRRREPELSGDIYSALSDLAESNIPDMPDMSDMPDMRDVFSMDAATLTEVASEVLNKRELAVLELILQDNSIRKAAGMLDLSASGARRMYFEIIQKLRPALESLDGETLNFSQTISIVNEEVKKLNTRLNRLTSTVREFNDWLKELREGVRE